MKKYTFTILFFCSVFFGCTANTGFDVDKYFAEAKDGENTMYVDVFNKQIKATLDTDSTLLGYKTGYNDGVYFIISLSPFTYIENGSFLYQFVNPVIPLKESLEDLRASKKGTLRKKYSVLKGTGEALQLYVKDGLGAEKLKKKDLSFDPNDNSLNVRGLYAILDGEVFIDELEKDEITGQESADGVYRAVFELKECLDEVVDIGLQEFVKDNTCNRLPKTISLEGAFSKKFIGGKMK